MKIAAVTAALLLAGCSSSSGGSGGAAEIEFGTPAAEIAQTLGICDHPVKAGAAARCEFPAGTPIVVNSIAGPADQQLAVPTARKIDTFCELVGHGFEVVALSYTDLDRHVDLNAIVAKYGGTIAGGTC